MAMPKHVTSPPNAEGVAEYTKCVSPERQSYPAARQETRNLG